MVNGIFKEILVDHNLFGIPIQNNLRIIAACNPYKNKPKVETFTTGLKHNKHKEDKGANLVYRVEPMCYSLFEYVWNFDKLDEKS